MMGWNYAVQANSGYWLLGSFIWIIILIDLILLGLWLWKQIQKK